MKSKRKVFTHDDYMVGWISALPLEMAVAKEMLDDLHPKLSHDPNDSNNYALGSVFGNNVVIAYLPFGVYGTTSAATVATDMRRTFRAIRISLMVGIGGGVPTKEADIRLGDVVVSKPTDSFGGVIQYDYGKKVRGGTFLRTDCLNKPPQLLLTAVSDLQAEHIRGSCQIPTTLSQASQDHLYEAEYDHQGTGKTCDGCSKNMLVGRLPRDSSDPVIHYGLIASGSQVIKDGVTRDRLARELGILCFEMEAAGLMDHFPCLVIRGICDYSDTHKNKQ
ncbi:5'-methylthioadenosine/S-adenosylhomocysteine nucleosidase family protein [Aspergillus ibericus CBS 121593]|uniref:Pfs domain protein n=1 Tax=Aspergillus ibericus CBS 121593 TaxID=1448316 RepID=A0A395H4L6_9EURO|nr:Pfs domain protein [Aspergillus ibericus CBS 121593]RAL02822.1 Pfs domain protein [Aspergillus ibericus CBS 121593]